MISYLQGENITRTYGDVVLFEDISFSIHKEQKIALIAKNGAGKTSLLDIVAGKETPNGGKITMKSGLRIGYLEQNPFLDENNHIIDAVFGGSDEMTTAIKHYEKSIKSGDEANIQLAIETMDRLKAWDFEVKVKQILSELKIDEFEKPISKLSGGQKKRVALASILINEPDLLILDEPTNHLDLEMIEWLEQFLINSKSTLFMVTHDRYFLDRVCNEILELDEKKIFVYKGNYSYFLEKREERINNTNAEIEKARSVLRKELEWIRKTPSARTTKAKYRVNAFYELEEKASKKLKKDQVNINIGTSRLGKKTLNVHSVSKSYGENTLFEDFTYFFRQYEKAGIVGNNGTGKTTLLEILANRMQPDMGRVEFGETVKLGYYRQDGMKFNEEQKVIDLVKDIAEVVQLSDGKSVTVSSFLNSFLFTPKMQQVQVAKLSGGEKRRLYLLTVLMKSPNFLILDEPTNDFDIVTLNILEEYLQQFPGCVLIVSHDRYFMDKVVDSLFVFKGNSKIENFPGNYSDYRSKAKKAVVVKNVLEKKIKVQAETSKDNPRKLTFKEKREMELLEKELDELNQEKNEIEKELGNGPGNQEILMKLTTRLGEIITLIDNKELRWLELSEISG